MIKTDAMYAELVHKIDQATESGQIDAIKNRLDAIEADIPADASSSNKFSTASDITGITEKIPEAASSSNKMATASDITGITEKIPEAASGSNKLITKSEAGLVAIELGEQAGVQALANAIRAAVNDLFKINYIEITMAPSSQRLRLYLTSLANTYAAFIGGFSGTTSDIGYVILRVGVTANDGDSFKGMFSPSGNSFSRASFEGSTYTATLYTYN